MTSLLARLVHAATAPLPPRPEGAIQAIPPGESPTTERNAPMSPAAKAPNPLTQRINAEARAIRRILNVVGGLDHAGRGRVLRTVIEMADEMQSQTAQHRGGNQGAPLSTDPEEALEYHPE